MSEQIFKNFDMYEKNTIKYSFAVDTYNQENVIVGCLNSIVGTIRKYDMGKCSELIIADDGSSDHNVSIIKKWIEEKGYNFACIKLLTEDKNSGTAKNASNALRQVEGKSVFWCDGDDMLCGNDVFSVMDECSDDEIITCPVVRFMDNTILVDRKQYYSYVKYSLYKKKDIFKKSYYSTPLVNGCVIGKKMLCDRRVLDFSENVIMLDDRARYIKIFELYPNLNIRYKNIPFIFYRTSENQVSNRNGRVFSQIVKDWKWLDQYIISRDKPGHCLKMKMLIEEKRLENPDNLCIYHKYDIYNCMDILKYKSNKRKLDALIDEFLDETKYQKILEDYLKGSDR